MSDINYNVRIFSKDENDLTKIIRSEDNKLLTYDASGNAILT